MKPANFPGRKNKRRQRALTLTYNKINRKAAQIEESNLKQKIVEDSVACATRTKKDRSAKGTVTR